MLTHHFFLTLPLLIAALDGASQSTDEPETVILDPRAFGAVGNGTTMDTIAIQKAIDRAAEDKNGTVRLSNGTFLSGTLALRSGVTLRIDRGATLLGSTHRTDYKKNRWYALLLAHGQTDIAVCGEGVIDGQGAMLAADVAQMVVDGTLDDPLRGNRPDEKNRPQLIEFTNCRNVSIRDITLRDSSCWVQAYNNCEDLTIERVKVRSTAYWNNDGLDLVDCTRVRVSGCDINSADDGICFKSADVRRACEDVLVENCKVRSSGSAFKLGTTSRGGFRRIKVRHLEVYDTFRSAVAIESVDGAVIDGVDISGVVARNTGNALFIRLGHRNQDGQVGEVKNIQISDLKAEIPDEEPDRGYPLRGRVSRTRHNLIPSSITGLPGHPVVGVTLRQIDIGFGGGGRRDRAWIGPRDWSEIPERPDKYPEFSMFGELPAWGLYCRHVDSMVLENLTLRLMASDERAALALDDVSESKISHITASPSLDTPMILTRHAERTTFHECVSLSDSIPVGNE
jgi:hypothetical protein